MLQAAWPGGSKEMKTKKLMEKRQYTAIAKALATARWLHATRRIAQESGFISNALALRKRRARIVSRKLHLFPLHGPILTFLLSEMVLRRLQRELEERQVWKCSR